MDKLALSIKKYNSETKKTSFYKDVLDIKSQKIIKEINNFTVDFEMENEMRLNVAEEKFYKIYNKKVSSISNQNFILIISILNEKFFEENNLDLFTDSLYNSLNKYFNILSFVSTKDNIGDITFYCVCSAVVKNVFLDHIVNKVTESGRTLESLYGVLSYNLILGGSVAENPEKKFIRLLLTNLAECGYGLDAATKEEKSKYILDSYERASNIITEYSTLINKLSMKEDIKVIIEDIIIKNNLNIKL